MADCAKAASHLPKQHKNHFSVSPTSLQDMAAAGFPVVEQLGQFKMDSWPQPLWVYQVRAPAAEASGCVGSYAWSSCPGLAQILLRCPAVTTRTSPTCSAGV
jgi:hypothetical protein